MRHDPAAGAIVIMLRSRKLHGMAQAVTDLIERGAVNMATATIIQGLRESAASAKATDHLRAGDLQALGDEAVDALAQMLPHLWTLRRHIAGQKVGNPEAADAIAHLAARAASVEMLGAQYEQIKADLGGEGYALLKANGDGVPYFSDADDGEDKEATE